MNPGQNDPTFGISDYWINIQNQRINTLGRFALPRILPDEPFVLLEGGQKLSLYRGALQLDLSEAKLRFPNGHDAGVAQVQMLLSGQFPHDVAEGSPPLFAWHLQPAGIEVSGDVSLTINIPSLNGSYAHVPPDGTRVLLIGFDPQLKQLVPAGAGVIDGRQVHSSGELVLKSLDYLAYALVVGDQQEALADWEAGEMQSINQLFRELQEVR
ncbi:MAG: hypothetical protein CSB44_05605 [Gammaproteobacteria bacterium]|nr:MAG: hypothetical protein CSB44_05605 [Gammaproteobacteria bacterium]